MTSRHPTTTDLLCIDAALFKAAFEDAQKKNVSLLSGEPQSEPKAAEPEKEEEAAEEKKEEQESKAEETEAAEEKKD
jgi:Ran-binding protein 1